MVKRKKKFHNIAIYSSINSKEIHHIEKHIEEMLRNLGLQLLIPKSSRASAFSSKKPQSDNHILNNSDLVVAIGGDGTLLSCARKFGSKGIPVLGVNLGNLGFLTDIAPSELTSSFRDVLNGKYIAEERMFLKTSVNNDEGSSLALNEIVVHSKNIAQLIEYELFIDNEFVFRQRADGIMISSPTGSTAYSLSAGGSLVHPEVRAISILPMFAHSLNTRPLIIKDDAEITIKICKKGSAQLSLDSHKISQLKTNDIIKISRSSSNLCLIHPVNHDFYSACRTKLGWSLGMKTKIDIN